MPQSNYTEDNIKSLDWKEHIRLRPGMYIGKLGDGSSRDDGIYILLKEVLDNCIDEYVMGFGKNIELAIEDGKVRIRDYGRGIPLGKVIDCVSKINTGGKYDSKAFKKSVGLNGVGTKAVNALSTYFRVQSIRDNKTKVAEFERGAFRIELSVELQLECLARPRNDLSLNGRIGWTPKDIIYLEQGVRFGVATDELTE